MLGSPTALLEVGGGYEYLPRHDVRRLIDWLEQWLASHPYEAEESHAD
jgi:hypothetical protein